MHITNIFLTLQNPVTKIIISVLTYEGGVKMTAYSSDKYILGMQPIRAENRANGSYRHSLKTFYQQV